MMNAYINLQSMNTTLALANKYTTLPVYQTYEIVDYRNDPDFLGYCWNEFLMTWTRSKHSIATIRNVYDSLRMLIVYG
jgi:hypothetical protein